MEINVEAVGVEVLTPEQLEDRLKKEQEERLAKLEALGSTLSKSRDEAVSGRRESGIEDDWLDDEEAYEGIDDANRDIFRNRAKPLSPEGGADKLARTDNRSRVFLNITRPYVDAAAAKVADMLLPTDEQNWGLEETPIPDLMNYKQDASPVITPDGQPVMAQDGHQVTVNEQIEQILEQAKEAAKKAERRIDDWLAECNYNSEVRKLIEDSSRIGTGVMKGPFPTVNTRSKVKKEGGLTSVESETYLAPASRAISPWNFFPDPSCGDNIHKGSHTWERDTLTRKQVRDLKDNPAYIPEMLDAVLKEGPQLSFVKNPVVEKGRDDVSDKDTFEVWYYYGFIEPDDMEVAGCACDSDRAVPALVVMINDHVVMAAENPHKDGAFPYDVMPWQRRIDHWAGSGVSRQMRTPQRMLNAATRSMMDNAGMSSGPQIVARRTAIEPANGVWEIAPKKLWFALDEYEGPVRDAFEAIDIPSRQADLMGIIQFAQKMGEDVTGLPMLLQGQQGAAPETVGGMQMLNNNASTVMRRIARTFDDNITEPHIRRYYQWLLDDPDVPEEEKGDYKIIARGSSALVERDIQNQTIAQMGAMVLNPAFGINPKLWIAEYFKSQRLDPNAFMFTEEELQQMQEAAAQNPPQDPATIRAQTQLQIAQVRREGEMQKVQVNQQSDMQELQFKAQEAERDRQHERDMRNMEYQMKMMEFAEKRNITLEQLKTQLADTALKERNRRDMFVAEKNLALQTGSGI